MVRLKILHHRKKIIGTLSSSVAQWAKGYQSDQKFSKHFFNFTLEQIGIAKFTLLDFFGRLVESVWINFFFDSANFKLDRWS